jgi:tetratricopeptide (TPR) repeat protein
MRSPRRIISGFGVALVMCLPLGAEPAKSPPPSTGKGDVELAERLLNARREYALSLEQLLNHYKSVGDEEKRRWAEEELRQFHRINKQAYVLDLDVPPPTLKATKNIPEANALYTDAVKWKNHGGFGNDYIDNQRRAELLLQQLLSSYPESDKIGDAAYQLGDLYEGKAYQQPRRSAIYFERCYQWHQNTHYDARIRAARLYDKTLQDRPKAIEVYKEVIQHETEPRWLEEAKKRQAELTAGK